MAALRVAAAPVLDVIDTSRTACVVTVAEFIDLEQPAPVGEADFSRLVEDALNSGEVPIGPLAYAYADLQFDVSADAMTAWAFTQRAPRVKDLIGVLRLEPDRILIGGSRYGWLPGWAAANRPTCCSPTPNPSSPSLGCTPRAGPRRWATEVGCG